MTTTLTKPSDSDLAPQERSLLELYRFQSMPHAIGLDNTREDLRNMVQLMMELKGYSTGLQLSHLVIGEHSSLAAEGTLADDEMRKRKKREWQREYNRLMAELSKQFTFVFSAVKETIEDMKQLFDAEIEHLEDEIEDLEDVVEASDTDNKKNTAIKATISKKKQRLRKFSKMKEHVEAHETVLEKVGKEKDVSKAIDIQQTLTEDVHNFYQNEDLMPITAPKKSIYAGMAAFMKVGDELKRTYPSYGYDRLDDAAFSDDDEPQDDMKNATSTSSSDDSSGDTEEKSTPEINYDL